MIQINNSIETAIETPKSIHMTSKVYIQPSIIYMGAFDSSFAPAFADDIGISNDPIPQEIAYISSGSAMCSFFTDGNALKYMLEGSSTVITISLISCIGKIGVYGNSLFLVNSSFQLKKYGITWSSILGGSATPLDAGTTITTLPESVAYSACAVSETEVVAFYYDDGGFKAVLYDGTTPYEQENRFMFPVFAEHERLNRSIQGMATHTTAVRLNDEIFAYISNPLTGNVDGIKFNDNSKTWSDIYVAVPTDLDVTQYETRIANSYIRDGVIYMSCQLHQIELVETEVVVSFIISSRDGKSFAYNRYTSVSGLGYRFLACINNNTIMISSCNRIAKADTTYIFSPTSGSDSYTEEITSRLSTISGNQADAELSFSDSDYSISRHKWMKEGNRILLDVGYQTVNGIEYTRYGTYIIASIKPSTTPTNRFVTLTVVNESAFNLSIANAPYYTEVISKSSVFSDFDSLGDFVSSGSAGLLESGFAIDLWSCQGYNGFGATPVTIDSKGGLDAFEFTGSHIGGVKTEDLKTALGINSYPVINNTTTTVKVYGWSFDDRPSGSTNDQISVALICVNSLGETYTSGSSAALRFANTYPDAATGDYPIEAQVTTVIGDFIKEIAILFIGANDTMSYISTIEIYDGLTVNYPFKTNTLWIYDEDTNKYKLPDRRKPFVMLTEKPYDAYNFIMSVGFEHDIVGHISGFTQAMGIVGLAFDNGNYIVGRYNLDSNKFQIAKYRKGIYTLLVEAIPTNTIGSSLEMQFEHKDGTFVLRVKVTNDWVDQVSYLWKESDGAMTLDYLISTKTGVYGIANTPSFRTTGYIPDSTEELDSCVGLAVLPGYDFYNNFPSSGKAKVNNNVYNYITKMTEGVIRGPFQFRQCGDGNSGHYVEPFGDGNPGLECRDMDWTRSPTQDIGRLCAIDDGTVFEIASTKWDVYITTGGATVELPGRARYCGSDLAAAVNHSLSNRVYMTHGLRGLTLYKGENEWHSWGEEVTYYYEGDIYCTYFKGASGNEDATIKDMINTISKSSGAVAEFNDINFATMSVTSGSDSVGELEYISGFDLKFETDHTFNNSDYIVVGSDAGFSEGAIHSTLKLIWNSTLSGFTIELYSATLELKERAFFETNNLDHYYRILYHDNFVTVYIDDRWAYTFCVKEIFYDTDCNIYLSSNSSITVNNVNLAELSDWSEAFYIDLDTDGRSAISQVIKERPVEIIQRSSGSIKYSYSDVRENLDIVTIRNFSEERAIPNQCASNAIIYADIVRTLQYLPYMQEYGFATRIFRMPNLTIGSLKAAKLLLKRGMESASKYRFGCRPDIRLEVSDKVGITTNVVGSGLSISVSLVIEQLTLSLKDGDYSMRINGRKAL